MKKRWRMMTMAIIKLIVALKKSFALSTCNTAQINSRHTRADTPRVPLDVSASVPRFVFPFYKCISFSLRLAAFGRYSSFHFSTHEFLFTKFEFVSETGKKVAKLKPLEPKTRRIVILMSTVCDWAQHDWNGLCVM